MRGFYFITDRGLASTDDIESVRQAVEGGASIIQYREKELEFPEMEAICKKMADICRGRTIFIVNDHVELAKASGADGVHVGQDDMALIRAREVLGPAAIIGVTVHDIDEAKKAVECGADYLGASPIYETSTKADAGRPSGLKLIEDIKRELDIPVAAIGGISRSNVDEVIGAGADMVCAISATVCERDITGAVKWFSDQF